MLASGLTAVANFQVDALLMAAAASRSRFLHFASPKSCGRRPA
jgi:hypothetical protein